MSAVTVTRKTLLLSRQISPSVVVLAETNRPRASIILEEKAVSISRPWYSRHKYEAIVHIERSAHRFTTRENHLSDAWRVAYARPPVSEKSDC
jgi:hypothetical protein